MQLCRSYLTLITMGSLLLASFSTNAENSSSSDKWKFGGELYLWGASMDVKPNGGANVHMSFKDIVEDLEGGAMVMLGARKGRWTALTDILYLKMGDDFDGPVLGPVTTKIDVELDAWVISMAGGYTIKQNDAYRFDLLVGARYLDISLPIDVKAGPVKVKTTIGGHNWDGVAGVMGQVDLTDKWYINYYADAGAGDSEFTWQMRWGLSYRFDKVDAVFGYRHLSYKFEGGGELDNLTLKGPFGGVKFFF